MPVTGPPYETISDASSVGSLPPPTTLPTTPVGRGCWELYSLLSLRLRRHHHVAMPISSPHPTTTPTPMPAFAPTVRSGLSSARDIPLSVGVIMALAQRAEP